MSEKIVTVLEAANVMGIKLNKNQLSSLGSRMINKHPNLYVKHGKRGGKTVRLYKDTPQFYDEVLNECRELKFYKN
jgi:hypothetical protein